MIEAAIALPLLLFLLFGVLETGLVMRSYTSTDNGVRTGGRTASVAGNESMADRQILLRMSEETAALDAAAIDYIIVWHAAGPDSTVPAACITAASGSGPNQSSAGVSDGGAAVNAVDACNVYIDPGRSGGAFARARGANYADYFGCTDQADPTRLDCRWPPGHRQTQVSPRVLPSGTPESARLRPDYVGIYMRFTHTTASQLVFKDLTITDFSINLLEPDTFGVDD